MDDESQPQPAETLDSDRLGDLFAFGAILNAAIKNSDYQLSQETSDALHLSDYGADIYDILKQKYTRANDGLLKLALFCENYWREMFFDGRSDTHRISTEISNGLVEKRIRLPFTYAGMLYKKANEVFSEIRDALEPAETSSLLAETPQGVFQMRSYVSGPFGLLRSRQKRDHRPTRGVPLFHCSDPSCTAIHGAILKEEAGPYSSVRNYLRGVLRRRGEPAKHPRLIYHQISEDADYYDDLYTGDLVPLLGDAFSVNELRAVLTALLDKPGGLRGRLKQVKLGTKARSSQQIAAGLDEAGCLQLILLEQDKTIIETIEILIDRGVINIPLSEVRSARTYHDRGGWYRLRCEASRHGIRFATRVPGVPLARLKRLIRQLYEPSGNLGELDWRLRYIPGETTSQKLDHYVNETDPEAVLLDHVLASASAPERAFGAMRYGYFPTSFKREEEPRIIKKLIWKFGFDVPVYPLEYRSFIDSVNKLRLVSDARSTRGSEDILQIRSAAVNFFVELEKFLADSLVFMFWVLTADHYSYTKFSYDKSNKHEMIANNFADYQSRLRISEPIKFREDGKNTLFPLIAGFRLLAEFCRELIRDQDRYIRPTSQAPGYVGRPGLHVFPFRHTKLVLDLRENVRTSVLSHLIEITELLENAKLAAIRNRTEHARDDFPSTAEISSLLDVVSSLADRMQKNGFAPLTYVLLGYQVDRWGRAARDFGNYREDIVSVYCRGELEGSGIPDGPGPIIIVPLIKLGDTEDIFRVSYTEPSDFVEMWKGYPIKRTRPISDTGGDGAAQADADYETQK